MCQNARQDFVTTNCSQHQCCRICYNDWIGQIGLSHSISCPECFLNQPNAIEPTHPQYYYPFPTTIEQEDLDMYNPSNSGWTHGPLLPISSDFENLKVSMGSFVRHTLEYDEIPIFQILMNQSNTIPNDDELDQIHLYVLRKSDVLPEICKTICNIHVEIVTVKVRGFIPADLESATGYDVSYEEEKGYYCPKDTIIVPSIISPKQSKWLSSPVMPLKYEAGLLDMTIGLYVRYIYVVDEIVVFQILIDATKGLIEYEYLNKLRAYFRFESDEKLLNDRYMHIEKIDTNLRLMISYV